MESWMISIGVAAASIIASFAVVKSKAEELKKNQEHIFKRLDSHGDDIVTLNTLSKLAMTAKDVDDKYVSKELFRQFEKHIDKRFDGLEAGQGKILTFIERMNSKDK